MPTLYADKSIQRSRLLERKRIKQLFVVLSTAPVPEKKTPAFTKPERPSYLRYIEYV